MVRDELVYLRHILDAINTKECQEIAFTLGNCQQELATLIVENAQRLSKKSAPWF